MRYRLRTLLIVAAFGPPIFAFTYWTAIWLVANPHAVFGLMAILAYLACWIVVPLIQYLWARSDPTVVAEGNVKSTESTR